MVYPFEIYVMKEKHPLHNRHTLTLLPQLACTIDHHQVLFEAVNIQINLNCSVALEAQGSVVSGETHWHQQDRLADHQQGYSECDQARHPVSCQSTSALCWLGAEREATVQAVF